MNYLIEKLKKENIFAIKQLLNEVNLPSEDIEEHWKTFLIAKAKENIIGAVGLELWKNKALLRSLVVKNDFRNFGIGKDLYNKCIELANQNSVTEIGLLTTTAEKFFAKQGFEKIAKENIPEFIKQTKEFKVYCPSSSVVMIKKLLPRPEVFSKNALQFIKDKSGSKFWFVSLEKVMFTYFEIFPDSTFELHSHESEQITYILEGKLFFEFDGAIHELNSGDAIAIPSNVPHKVWTTEQSVKAVDAWSPVREEFKSMTSNK